MTIEEIKKLINQRIESISLLITDSAKREKAALGRDHKHFESYKILNAKKTELENLLIEINY